MKLPSYLQLLFMPLKRKAEYMAEWKLEDMIKTGYWKHDLSDGTTFKQRCFRMLFSGGEVLYKGMGGEKEAVELWLKSPTHKAVMDSFKRYVQKEKGEYIIRIYY